MKEEDLDKGLYGIHLQPNIYKSQVANQNSQIMPIVTPNLNYASSVTNSPSTYLNLSHPKSSDFVPEVTHNLIYLVFTVQAERTWLKIKISKRGW